MKRQEVITEASQLLDQQRTQHLIATHPPPALTGILHPANHVAIDQLRALEVRVERRTHRA